MNNTEDNTQTEEQANQLPDNWYTNAKGSIVWKSNTKTITVFKDKFNRISIVNNTGNGPVFEKRKFKTTIDAIKYAEAHIIRQYFEDNWTNLISRIALTGRLKEFLEFASDWADKNANSIEIQLMKRKLLHNKRIGRPPLRSGAVKRAEQTRADRTNKSRQDRRIQEKECQTNKASRQSWR